MLSNRVVFAASKYFNQAVTPEIIDEVMTSLQGSQSAINVGTIAKNKFEKIAPKKIGAFTGALVSLIKSGQASDLLMAGTKSAGIGIPLEFLLANKAEAAELYNEKEKSDLNIAVTFGGVEGYKKKQKEILKNKGIGGL
jgi:hypothetical protein